MLRLYDSLKKKVLDVAPARGKEFRVYACGPTVYKDAHIGNMRSFTMTDLLRRYLEHKGYRVKLVMNITDVGHALHDEDAGEDKIEKSAREEGKRPEEIARFYEKRFFQDLETLNIRRAWKHPRATEHVGEMIAVIERLLEKGHAYVTDKGDVYYDVSSFPDYGKLSGNAVAELVAGARVDVKGDKRDPADFALWIRNPDHVMQWNSPWGSGYPGWHIECSAMAMRYLGETLDVHIGGEDNKFPHHECEIAQSEGATDQVFARHWLHWKHLVVEGEKMSKSLGNFYTLRQLMEKGATPQAVRWLFLTAQYRQPLNFTFAGLDDAEAAVRQFAELKERLKKADGKGEPPDLDGVHRRFEEAMDDDLNVSAAVAVLHDLRKDMNRRMDEGVLSKKDARAAGKLLTELIEGVFGIELKVPKARVPKKVQAIADQRESARARKDWAESDRLRDELAKLGWHAEDGPEGQKLRKAG